MTDQLKTLSLKIDKLIEQNNILVEQNKLILEILSTVLVEADYLTKVIGLNKKTISQNKMLERFQGIGKRKLLIKIESVPVVRALKRKDLRK